MPNVQARSPAGGSSADREGYDFLDHLGEVLRAPPPQNLVVTGPVGAGKSTLLRTMIPRLPGPLLFLAYRFGRVGEGSAGTLSGSGTHLSLLLIETASSIEGDTPVGEARPPDLHEADPTVSADVPVSLARAVGRLAARGGGVVLVDTWDASSERDFREAAGAGASVSEVECDVRTLRAQFGRAPVRGLMALAEPTDSEVLSSSDGVIELGWEEVDGFRLRVLSIPKMRQRPPPETRYLYSLEGARFYCPPQFPPGFHPPIGPASPDPEPDMPGLFPGSADFMRAFGRLRYRGLTALEVPPHFSSIVGDVFLYPLVAHTLSVGGRVVWVPAAGSSAGQIVGQLSKSLPEDFLRERLRILSAGGSDLGSSELRPVVLPVRRESEGSGGEIRAAIAPSVGPMFPDAFRFLQAAPDGKPSLFVIYLDGITALTSVAEIPIKVETYPLVVSSYTRIPRFHGLGFGRSDDPLVRGLIAEVDTHIRIEERYGRSVLFGLRPRTSPYILDWSQADGRYSLVPVR